MKPTDVVSIREVPVTRLGLGSAPLGGLFRPVTPPVADETVNRAYELGLRFFDTAPLYGYGTAEQRVGHALASVPRGSWTLATKVGRLLRNPDNTTVHYDVDTTQSHQGIPIYKDTGAAVPVFDFSYDGAMRSLEESMTRLAVDHVDVVHVHDPDDHLDVAIGGAYKALAALREQGVIGAVGLGIDHAPPAVRFIRETDIDCVLIAGRWTLLDQEALDELLPLCLDRGVAVIAAGVFNSGVLAVPGDDATFDYVPSLPATTARAKDLARVCESYGIPLKAAALQFPYRHPAVRCVVVGARSPEEIEENVRLAGVDIPSELWDALAVECNVPSLR